MWYMWILRGSWTSVKHPAHFPNLDYPEGIPRTNLDGTDAVMSLTADAPGLVAHVRHRPEQTLLYQLVERHYPAFARLMAEQGSPLPGYVAREFEDYLKCGRLEHGFLRVRCESCHHEKLVAFSCKRRGFCPSCGARRMVDSAVLLVDAVLPQVPLRQWVLSVPFQLRFLFASYPDLMSKALGLVYRTIATWLIHQAGFTRHSISYRIAIGPQQGKKVFTL